MIFMKTSLRLTVVTIGALLTAIQAFAWEDSTGEKSRLTLAVPGSAEMVDYEKFGEFRNVGTEKFCYVIKDRKGLAEQVGEGVDPCQALTKDPVYLELKKKKAFPGPHWDYTDHANLPLRFYAWAGATEDGGVRQYYTAKALEDNGLLIQALRGYYAVVLLYPRAVGWSFWKSPLYMSRMALDRIEFLLRKHPELHLALKDAYVKVENGFDDDVANDRILVNPGHWVKESPTPVVPDLKSLKIVKKIGGPNVELVQYENMHWQLLKDGKPFMMRGMDYVPTPVGMGNHTEGYDVNGSWQLADSNHNGKIDAIEESWIDTNGNEVQDPDEPWTTDMQILQDMGVNTIRIYNHVFNKDLLKRWHEKNGTMFLIGDFAGAYAAGSGATWEAGTDYSNPEQVERLMALIKKMVLDVKDEPYVLMWVLGNENVYGVANSAKRDPVTYWKFINRAAEMIHELDPHHPVAVSSGDLYLFDSFVANAPAVDVYGCNIYRGNGGMGKSFWRSIFEFSGKPVFISEFGCSAYANGRTKEEVENFQKDYHQGNWEDIEFNKGGGLGYGNALGGMAFEFCDEWWKAEHLPMEAHDVRSEHPAPFCDGNNYEEWYGLFSVGTGKNSPFMRQPRAAVDYYKNTWK